MSINDMSEEEFDKYLNGEKLIKGVILQCQKIKLEH